MDREDTIVLKLTMDKLPGKWIYLTPADESFRMIRDDGLELTIFALDNFFRISTTPVYHEDWLGDRNKFDGGEESIRIKRTSKPELVAKRIVDSLLPKAEEYHKYASRWLAEECDYDQGMRRTIAAIEKVPDFHKRIGKSVYGIEYDGWMGRITSFNKLDLNAGSVDVKTAYMMLTVRNIFDDIEKISGVLDRFVDGIDDNLYLFEEGSIEKLSKWIRDVNSLIPEVQDATD